MKKLLLNFIIILVLVTAFLGSSSVGYAFFDSLSATDSINLQIGEWQMPNLPLVDFESFTNTSTGNVNLSINDVDFLISNVVAGNTSNDRKNNLISARIIDTGYLKTTHYTISVNKISFYIGMAYNSPLNGALKYYVNISNNDVDFTEIYSSSASKNSFDYVEIDIESILNNGVIMPDGTIATNTTPIIFQFYFEANGSGTKLYNIDDILIERN